MPANVEKMAYVGETPWHGLGTQVAEGVGVDEMLVAAGLDWQVKVANSFYTPDGGERRVAPMSVMYRGDTGDVLDTVGPRYVPVQNREVLEFFRSFVAEGRMDLNTAGSLTGGRYVWALAKMRDGFKVGKGDDVEGYLLMANPHQYAKSYQAKFTEVRVVCQNTMTAALRGGGESVKLWHNRPFDDGARQEARERLGLAKEALADAEGQARQLAATKITDRQALKLAVAIMGGKPEERKVEEQPRGVRRVLELFGGAGKGATLPTAAGTAWGLLNAVTQFTDWEYGKAPDARVQRAWFGAGEVVKRRAKELLLTVKGGK